MWRPALLSPPRSVRISWSIKIPFFSPSTFSFYIVLETGILFFCLINSLKPLPISQTHRPGGALNKMRIFICHLVAGYKHDNWEPNCSITCCYCHRNSCQSAKTKGFKIIIVSKLSFTPLSADWHLLPRKQMETRVAGKLDSPTCSLQLCTRDRPWKCSLQWCIFLSSWFLLQFHSLQKPATQAIRPDTIWPRGSRILPVAITLTTIFKSPLYLLHL